MLVPAGQLYEGRCDPRDRMAPPSCRSLVVRHLLESVGREDPRRLGQAHATPVDGVLARCWPGTVPAGGPERGREKR